MSARHADDFPHCRRQPEGKLGCNVNYAVSCSLVQYRPTDDTRPKISIVINGAPQMANGIRIANLFDPLADRFQLAHAYRTAGRLGSFLGFAAAIERANPDLVYAVDIGYSTSAAMLQRALRGRRYILHTGDPAFFLLRNMGRAWIELQIARAMEQVMPAMAEHIVSSGHGLAQWYRERGFTEVSYIPDGVDLQRFQPHDVSSLRQELGVADALTIGVVGSLNWNEKYQTCYGNDVVDVVSLVRDLPVKGIVVGGGTGLPHLREKAERLGVADRVVFTGMIPHSAMPDYICALDICLSTQTPDEAGKMRTTSKMAEYLACNRYVISSDVGGETHEILSKVGMLLPYGGFSDTDYPRRIAAEVRKVVDQRGLLSRASHARAEASARFDRVALSRKLGDVIDKVLHQSARYTT